MMTEAEQRMLLTMHRILYDMMQNGVLDLEQPDKTGKSRASDYMLDLESVEEDLEDEDRIETDDPGQVFSRRKLVSAMVKLLRPIPESHRNEIFDLATEHLEQLSEKARKAAEREAAKANTIAGLLKI